jgi:hypothetical protein
MDLVHRAGSLAGSPHRPAEGSTADSRAADTDQFYLLLSELARHVGGSRLLRDCAGTQAWPRHGVYFFFEDGETAPTAAAG